MAHPSFFETTIRHVGGLLSAYELSDFQYPVLLEKAEQVAEQLAYAFTGAGTFRWSRLRESDVKAIHRIMRSRMALSTLLITRLSTER